MRSKGKKSDNKDSSEVSVKPGEVHGENPREGGGDNKPRKRDTQATLPLLLRTEGPVPVPRPGKRTNWELSPAGSVPHYQAFKQIQRVLMLDHHVSFIRGRHSIRPTTTKF
jgi:hypothetical protein